MASKRHPDHTRTYYLYRYLFGRLAVSRKSSDRSPNAAGIAGRVGGKDQLRKLIPSIFADEKVWQAEVDKSSKSKLMRATTGRVVDMLSKLRKSLQQEYEAHEISYNQVLTTEDILIALYQLIDLTPDERDRLGLPIGDGLTLLKQTLLKLQTQGGIQNYEALFRAYKEAVGLDFTDNTAKIHSLDEVDTLICDTVAVALSYLPARATQKDSKSNQDTINNLARKAQREIRRLLARSGNTQSFFTDRTAEHPYISNYLPPAFVKKLAQTVVVNERLTDQFPVHLKHISTKTFGPLPFADTSLGTPKFGSVYPPLLNKTLQALDGSANYTLSNDMPGPSDYELASQESTKITIDFYIKIPDGYQSVAPKTFERMVNSTEGDREPRRVDFTFSSTGVGGTLSHIIKLINVVLLSDIPCLDNFFPIAHDVTSTQTIVRDNVPSPVWAHSLVKLCHKETVASALWRFKGNVSAYDEFSFGEPTGCGDFCGFDFLLAQAQASLQARLQAICNTGINPQDYIEQLCNKVERQLALKHAWQDLKYYPFSSMAMIGTIHKTIIGSVFHKNALDEDDPYIYFDAYLSIVEVLLEEGAYRASWPYLQKLEVLEAYSRIGLNNQSGANIDSDRCADFSSTLVIRYLTCLATYYYLYDIEDKEPGYAPKDLFFGVGREPLIQKAWETLDLAQQYVDARLKKYIIIGEISQGTFHPHYELLGRIYGMRAKLLTFFSSFVPQSALLPTENFSGQQRTRASAHWGRLYLLEKARLYIAADGNSEIYAYCAAMQSCFYLSAAYDGAENVTIKTGPNRSIAHELSRQDCLAWAKKLRDHALLSYADTGRQCYNAIKEKSGLPGVVDDYGRYLIEKLPAIFEVRESQQSTEANETNKFLTLDISLLAVNITDLPKLTAKHPNKNIYLFGTNACYLFFARGLYLLCSDTTDEFARVDSDEEIDWPRKLLKAMRLFDMAWAIAEDGCSLEREPGSRRKQIARSFQDSGADDYYRSQEVKSVRDLYPRRVNEVADLGKVFSAACIALRCHTLPAAERSELIYAIDRLFGMFHGQYRLKNNRLLKALLLRQARYNGHLETGLQRIQPIIKNSIPAGDRPANAKEIKAARTALITALSTALLT